MSMRVTCICGAAWEAPAGSEALTCAACGRSVPLSTETPAEPKAEEESTRVVGLGDIARCELIRDTEGREWWKMTCVCGKRVRSPARTSQPYGRCPKCGSRLKMPGFLLSHQPVLVSAAPGQKPVAADKNTPPPAVPRIPPAQPPPLPPSANSESGIVDPKAETRAVVPIHDPVRGEREGREEIPMLVDDESETVAVEAVLADMRVNQAAFQRVADRLRPLHNGGPDESTGRISAWPLAGMMRRALAAAVDLTLAILLAGIVLVLASLDVLPPALLRGEVVALLFILAGWLNDGVLQLLIGETLGKRLVVVVTRTLDGAEMGVGLLLLRALLKWLIVPGWLIALIDPNERALHDLVCGTLVLRGRSKRQSNE